MHKMKEDKELIKHKVAAGGSITERKHSTSEAFSAINLRIPVAQTNGMEECRRIFKGLNNEELNELTNGVRAALTLVEEVGRSSLSKMAYVFILRLLNQMSLKSTCEKTWPETDAKI